MSTPPPNLDPIAVLVVVASAIFSREVAEVAGPYLAIFLASSLGAYYRLGQRSDMHEAGNPPTRWAALRFFLAVNLGALLFTVPVAKLAQSYLPSDETGWLLMPLAFGLGLVGERWPLVGNWAARRAARVLDVLLRNKTGGSP